MFLDAVVLGKRAEVEISKLRRPLEGVLRGIADRRPTDRITFKEAISKPGLGIIAEIKKKSPSRGDLGCKFSAAELASAYENAGACAISVLTDSRHFGGSLSDLKAAGGAAGLPLLRKDFIIDEYQIYEAKAYGADAVLLIVALLSAGELRRFISVSREVGLDALVEVRDRGELEVAVDAGAEIIGVNSRDLGTLQVDTGIFRDLIPSIPGGAISVAESGISGPDDLRALRDLGADAALIGTALATCDDPEAKLRELVDSVKE